MRRRGISVGVGPFRAWESWPVRPRRGVHQVTSLRRRRRWPQVMSVLGVLMLAGLLGPSIGPWVLAGAVVSWIVVKVKGR